MQQHDFSYDVHSDEAAAEFFTTMRNVGVGDERVELMKQTRTTFLAQEARTHAVYATTPDNKRVLVSEHLNWDTAQFEWRKLDDARLAGLMPHVKYFEVRSTDDPKYKDAPVSMLHRRFVVASRGNKNVEDAARKAWKLFAPEFKDRSRVVRRYYGSDVDAVSTAQGRGGWFYWPNGHTAAQGLDGLARVVQQRNMVVQGVDGRWYVVDPDFDAEVK